jgi:hypothetical protein
MARIRPAAPVLGALAALVLLLAGCTTPAAPQGTTPPPPAVEPSDAKPAAKPATKATAKPASPAIPAPVVLAKPASITGSEESSTMFDNFTAYVAAIDGHPVAADRAGWNVPLSLPAGPRRLTVAFMRGVFTARTEVQFQARSEASYLLKFATDAQIFGKNSYCEFWIEDKATGEKVVAPTRVPLTKIETGAHK